MSKRTDYADRLLRVLIHIQRNLDTALSLDELADVAALSRFHFHRIFLALTGETLGAHVRRLRLERAAHALAGGGRVTTTAFDAGYESPEAFSRAFRAHFGHPPSDHTPAHRGLLAAPSGVHWSPAGIVKRLNLLHEGIGLMNIREEVLADRRVLAMAHKGAYNEIGEAFGRLAAWGAAKGLMSHGGWCLGVYYDDPDAVPVDKLRSEACFESTLPADPAAGVDERIIKGGRYAVMLHRGPYTTLHAAWRRFVRDWAVPNGIQLADKPCFERYINDPSNAAPEDLLTDIYLPLK